MNDLEKPPSEVMAALLGEEDSPSVEHITGGLSGASVWCIAQKYALRHWPKAIADPSWIEKTAQVLRHAHAHGAPFVPEPIAPVHQTPNGDWWEATTWRPGTPDLERDPTPARIQAATEALAKFHHAVSDLSKSKGPSPAILQRIALLDSCVSRLPSQQAIPIEWHGIAERLAKCVPLLTEIAKPWVKRFAKMAMPLQPVQIDSRPEHFLFIGETVTGLIDFGAMRVDIRAVDIARLTGELAKGSHSVRNDYVRQYNAFAEEPVGEKLVEALDISGAVLASTNWLGWLADGETPLHDPAAIRQRLENLAERGERMAGGL